jgi:hypothetical protein
METVIIVRFIKSFLCTGHSSACSTGTVIDFDNKIYEVSGISIFFPSTGKTKHMMKHIKTKPMFFKII